MKVIAFYLPQFHEVEENNKWWGEGFTEWTNVKKSKPLFKGHYQPREPLNDNYYNLLDKKTLQWQANLAKKYNVDGFCFYHYWFKGKRLLDKPAEILLSDKNIDLPFLFSWANEPWTRSWDGGHRDVLMPQEYGDEQDWLMHFNYLRPFFEDERYIKHDGKPIFVLYRSANFERCSDWISFWRQLAKNTIFKDIHFVTSLTSFENDTRNLGFDAALNFEPMSTMAHGKLNAHAIQRKILSRIIKAANNIFGTNYVEHIQSYQDIWNKILDKEYNSKSYSGAFVDWDNSPRKKTKSLVMTGCTPALFQNNFEKIYQKSINSDVPFLFINAWNEWAEGTYLEPDKKNGYKFLESISNVVNKYGK